MNAYIVLLAYSILFALTYGQEAMDNCDDYESSDSDGETCYFCDEYDEDCVYCPALRELNCDTCSCQVTAGGYAVSIVFWALIYMCCGICIYSCRKGYCCRDCCYPEGMPGDRNALQKPLNSSANAPLPDSKTQFTKCKFCGWLERPGTLRCSKCNTSISSLSNIGSQSKSEQRVGFVANDQSVSEKSLPSESTPSNFIKCEACNRYQFAGSNNGDGKCFYCKKELPGNKEKKQEGLDQNVIDIGGVMDNEQIQCQGCNEIISKKNKFCPECGKKVELENEQRCVSCNQLFDKNGNFCPSCGSKAETVY
mmetsp:Transcript_10768/g.9702  ORF Transcript_10768/g.9702 Transcript_10768/m.9702 type:complete len:309 (+) Transcript_10768:82-1008(+)